MFYTFIALEPKYREERDSSIFLEEGPIFTISAVLELPPSESYKILVSFESLNGT